MVVTSIRRGFALAAEQDNSGGRDMAAASQPGHDGHVQPRLSSMDSTRVNKFHRRVTFLSGKGVFLEGYDFTNIASALIFLVLSVERIGRRTLAIVGFGSLAVIDLIIGLLSGNLLFIPLLILFSAFQLFAWIGPAGLVGVVVPEVFPTRMRSLGTGFVAAMGRLGSIVGIVALPFLLAHVQLRGVMSFFFADAAIAFVAMIIFGRETKGRSLEELFDD